MERCSGESCTDCICYQKVSFYVSWGYENASSEYNKDKITKLIKNSEFEFIYVGADIDSYAAGSSIGIRKENIANFKKDKKGTNLLFKSVGRFSEAMMCDESTANWSQELDNYINENKD